MDPSKDHLHKTSDLANYSWSSDEDDALTNVATVMSDNRERSYGDNTQTPVKAPNLQLPEDPGTSSFSGLAKDPPSKVERDIFWTLLCDRNRSSFDTMPKSNASFEDDRSRRDIMPSTSNKYSEPSAIPRLPTRTSPLHEIRNMLTITKGFMEDINNLNPGSARSTSPAVSMRARMAAANGMTRNSMIKKWLDMQPTTHLPRTNRKRPYPVPPTCSRATVRCDEQPSTSNGLVRHGKLRYHNYTVTVVENKQPVTEMAQTNITPQPMTTVHDALAEVTPEICPEVEILDPSILGPPNDSGGLALEEEVIALESIPTENNTEQNVQPLVEEQQDIQCVTQDNGPKEPVKDDSNCKELNQCLLRLLECPVCLDWMEPPMCQCRRGHLVCIKCRSRVHTCPVCRTAFSSVRNRAMEQVAEMLRYPCRHGCGKEVRLRRRGGHEASCPLRHYTCPLLDCSDTPPLALADLLSHFQDKHNSMLLMGRKHTFPVRVNSELHDNWIVRALDEIFHVSIEIDVNTWGLSIYVAYIGPRNNSTNFIYEISVDGKHNARKLVYRRATHSDLDSPTVSVSRQDCFHLSLDQALNFLRLRDKHCGSETRLSFQLVISRCESDEINDDSSDS